MKRKLQQLPGILPELMVTSRWGPAPLTLVTHREVAVPQQLSVCPSVSLSPCAQLGSACRQEDAPQTGDRWQGLQLVSGCPAAAAD